MDRGVRAGPSMLKECPLRTSGLVTTKRRGDIIPLLRRRPRGRQCSILHEQSLTRPRAKIPANRKDS
ncbi:hypothetical protein A2U01_0089305, partial [Trifolium medium]|nr:hypothetical protein [Trifolium medium]